MPIPLVGFLVASVVTYVGVRVAKAVLTKSDKPTTPKPTFSVWVPLPVGDGNLAPASTFFSSKKYPVTPMVDRVGLKVGAMVLFVIGMPASKDSTSFDTPMILARGIVQAVSPEGNYAIQYAGPEQLYNETGMANNPPPPSGQQFLGMTPAYVGEVIPS